ncbi:fructose bisphosphate aldolase [Parasphingorhabdus halotolerans]|uniref:fructose-bisphosphate aldolase n=1 Tax=Parasphingorhabdus halotolerans TaxID=2725558 RepID=A0A6H2DJZ8_9SPHN|nr:fructose bisphosphate aldolase [Parasphingorhabdus halotolerans]QJB68071.1 fructose bisphosphate aldolase [Parasphingorhabdus halotolerans]
MHDPKMKDKIEHGAGFIAALDQSGGSTPKALKGYGVEESAYSNDDEMFALIHGMRSRIATAPSFNGDKVIGAILFEKTMDGEADGKPMPTLLWERGIVPFLKVDKGLEDEADGVQMMKPMPELGALLKRAKAKGVFGTKMRSVINKASPTGIAANVKQQFEVASQILDHGLMPMIEPEVNIKSDERAECDKLVLQEITKQLDALPEDRKVMLKLSIPVEPNHYASLVDHPRVARVVALSGGFSRDEACTELAKNRGMIASFSRALLQDLRHGMTDAEFDQSLGSAIDQIAKASAT